MEHAPTAPSTHLSSPQPSARFCFGRWTFEPALHRLKADNETVRLEPKLASLLLFLLERPKQVVTKEELVSGVWQQAHIADSALTRAIAELRRALGDDARHPRFIETIPKSGYRWLIFPGSVGSESPRPGSQKQRWQVSRWLAAAATASLLGLGGFMAAHRPGPLPIPSVAEQEKLIAVMPLANLSGDPSQDYFAEGMTEALVTQLAQSGAVGVISRHSVDSLIAEGEPVHEIIARLSLDAVIDGSVVRDEDRVRISLRLTETGQGAYSWAQSYERHLSDILALQSEVSHAVAGEIRVALGPVPPSTPNVPRTSHRVDPEAYELYLKALADVQSCAKEGPNEAPELLRQALAIDPEYAPAHAALAQYYTTLATYGHSSSPRELSQAREAAERAIALDASLAQPHATLGTLRLLFDWRLDLAEAAFRRAIDLNPSHAVARKEYAFFLTIAGRFREAAEQAERASQLAPLESAVRYTKAHVYLHSGRYEDTIAAVHSAAKALGKPWTPHPYSAWAEALLGRYEAAIPQLEDLLARPERDKDDVILGSLGWVLAQSGDHPAAEEIRDRLRARVALGDADPFALALVFSGLGEQDPAIDALEQAFAQRSPHMLYAGVEPFLEPLAENPRFSRLLTRLGLDEIPRV